LLGSEEITGELGMELKAINRLIAYPKAARKI